MAKAVISIECLNPSDWDPILGDDSKLLQFLTTAGWELKDIDAESVKAFPEAGSVQGIAFNTNEMPIISFSRMVAVSSGHSGIISTKISFTEPAVIQGRAKRLDDMRTGAARVRVSEPRLLAEKELGLSDNQG